MKIALVYDRINKFGGAEQVILALHKLWPDAPIYTAVYDPKTEWAKSLKVVSSFLNKFIFFRRHHELLPLLTPVAFESFNFDQFDFVISITSSDAKAILTKPDTVHICYCLTPTRYLWSGFTTYSIDANVSKFTRFTIYGLKLFYKILRRWDKISAARPDYYIAISKIVQNRIEEFYEKKVSKVIYPPIDTDIFRPIKSNFRPNHLPANYFLVVSRLVKYKRIDLIIDACNELNRKLIVIGSGREADALAKKAGKNIIFVSRKLTTQELAKYYQYCEVFLFAAEEDFGIAAGEAQSCGKPVIAYKNSGVSEIIKDGITGVLYDEQTKESLIGAINKYYSMKIDAMKCRQRALQFSQSVFEENITNFVQTTKRN